MAILASGAGSNAEAILSHFASERAAEVAEVVWVCTNRQKAGVRGTAEEAVQLANNGVMLAAAGTSFGARQFEYYRQAQFRSHDYSCCVWPYRYQRNRSVSDQACARPP